MATLIKTEPIIQDVGIPSAEIVHCDVSVPERCDDLTESDESDLIIDEDIDYLATDEDKKEDYLGRDEVKLIDFGDLKEELQQKDIYSCVLCQERFRYNVALIYHLSTAHNITYNFDMDKEQTAVHNVEKNKKLKLEDDKDSCRVSTGIMKPKRHFMDMYLRETSANDSFDLEDPTEIKKLTSDNVNNKERSENFNGFHIGMMEEFGTLQEVLQQAEFYICQICKEKFKYNIALIYHTSSEHTNSEISTQQHTSNKNSSEPQKKKVKKTKPKRLNISSANSEPSTPTMQHTKSSFKKLRSISDSTMPKTSPESPIFPVSKKTSNSKSQTPKNLVKQKSSLSKASSGKPSKQPNLSVPLDAHPAFTTVLIAEHGINLTNKKYNKAGFFRLKDVVRKSVIEKVPKSVRKIKSVIEKVPKSVPKIKSVIETVPKSVPTVKSVIETVPKSVPKELPDLQPIVPKVMSNLQPRIPNILPNPQPVLTQSPELKDRFNALTSQEQDLFNKLMTSDGEPFYTCKKCKKIFKHKKITQLKKHVNECNRVSRFKCEFCNMTFVWELKFRKHMYARHKKIEFVVCQKCSKIFPNNEILEQHLQSCLSTI